MFGDVEDINYSQKLKLICPDIDELTLTYTFGLSAYVMPCQYETNAVYAKDLECNTE